MKNPVCFLCLSLLLILGLITSCKKKEVPTVITSEITEITGTTAKSGGAINDVGSSPIISRGVCWNTSVIPTIANNITLEGTGAGSFLSNITGLHGATEYFVRAYATNDVGTGYGLVVSLKTLGEVPSTTTQQTSDISTTTAILYGNINANYLSTVVTFEFGTTTSYGNSVTAIQSPLTGNINTNVNANLTGLTPGTIYHFRIKAVNELGTSYGIDLSFTTLGQKPTVTTSSPSGLTTTGATLNGIVNANYLATTVTFEYGTTTAYGNSITATQSPVTGNSNTNVNVALAGLTTGTTYHFRIKAVNELGTSYGADMPMIMPGLIGYYELEESSGSVLPQTGTVNGTVYGNPSRQQAGKNNFCYLFNGSSAIDLGDNTYRLTADFTISIWFKTTSISFQDLFSRYFSSTGYMCYRTHINTSGQIVFLVYNPSNVMTYIISPVNTVSTGQWYHVAFVKSGTTMKIILNNSVVASTNSAPLTIQDQTGNGTNLKTYIGACAKNNTIPDCLFNGYIDEVAIWNTGLSDQEVAGLWNNGNGSFPH